MYVIRESRAASSMASMQDLVFRNPDTADNREARASGL